MDAYKKKGVKFNYDPKDKELFLKLFERFGSEWNFVSVQKQHIKIPSFGEFDVIYADPPWHYNFLTSYSPEAHYPTLETDDICALKIPSSKDAILFLWATNPCLEDALKVMEFWGFEYKTNFVWVKNRSGTGHYILGQHELLLIGIKGKIGTPLAKNRPSSVINASKTKHSAKPEVVYEVIERMYPNAQYLELFARNKREGWTAWGNEV